MRNGGRWLLVATVVLVLVVGLLGFRWWQSRQVGPLEPDGSVTAAAASIVQQTGPAGESVTLVPGHPNGALVLYTHGNNQTARAVYAGTGNPAVSAALLKAGYTVTASDAYGNNWGNARAVHADDKLARQTEAKYGLRRVFVISESMGSLAGVQVARDVHAAGWVAYFPVCDLSSVMNQSDIAQGVRAAHAPVAAQSPVTVPAGLPVRIWASREDTRVPAAKNALVCAREAGASVTWTTGNHGDPSNFQPAAVVRFFDSLR